MIITIKSDLETDISIALDKAGFTATVEHTDDFLFLSYVAPFGHEETLLASALPERIEQAIASEQYPFQIGIDFDLMSVYDPEDTFKKTAELDRFDICEAYYIFEAHWNKNGWVKERPSNPRRRKAPYSIGVQLERIGFEPSPMLDYDTLSDNGRLIYDELVASIFGDV